MLCLHRWDAAIGESGASIATHLPDTFTAVFSPPNGLIVLVCVAVHFLSCC